MLARMSGLVACPFCREMFRRGEAKRCPSCGLGLERLEDLPPSVHTDHEPEEALHPDEERLPASYLGRGRGALLLVACFGIAAFFMPWVHERAPELRSLSGPELASRRLGWMWAPLIAWLVMIPLVYTRRSVHKMRGARLAVAMLSALAMLTVLLRLWFVPTRSALDPLRFEWGLGLWATLALSSMALGLSLRFGGRVDVLETKQALRQGDETLH
jgi:hypothetical protein